MGETKSRAIFHFQSIQGLSPLEMTTLEEPLHRTVLLRYDFNGGRSGAPNFSCISILEKREQRQRGFSPAPGELLKHPLAALSYVFRDVAIFAAGPVAEAVVKTVTSPLDRLKLLMHVL
ncbi:hypothetical protein like AT3G51870 [Hibiscus trionum]|uniref:Uncharacterized protein n=1 Tax=Hibiscus trionum TaxID=183268 RepID=A0A9W7IPG4_HIBTR|nr:hypothetical protein like AT3G51870 [Hibiscus trionum]